MKRKSIILLNPTSGRSRALRNRKKLEKLLYKYKVECELIITKSEEDMRQLIHKYASSARSIVTAGGDSSFTILVNEVIGLSAKLPIGIIPLGSSDDIAREFGIFTLEDSVVALANEKIFAADILKMSAKQRYVYYVPGQANLGIGVFVNRFVANTAKQKGFINKSQSIAGIIAMYAAFKGKIVPQKFKVKYDENIELKKYVSIVFSKIRYWAGGRIFLPNAKKDDGKIHILMVGKCSFFQLLGIMTKAQKARHIDGKIVRTTEAREVVVESETPFQIQVDGDILKKEGNELSFNKIKLQVMEKACNIFYLDKKNKI